MIQSNESLNSYIYLPDKYIHEEISIGSLIVDIADELEKQKSTTITNSIESKLVTNSDTSTEMQHFTFLEDVKSSTENTYYLIDSITGRITSKRYLDRESMCINKHCMEQCDLNQITKQNLTLNCKMNLKVLLIPSYDIVNLNIIIQDLNDNKPQFRIDLINQTLPENVPIGYKIPIDLAYDPDAGINSIQNYTLLSASDDYNTFQLIQQTLDSELALIVKQKLDREKIAQYNLSISACDGGVPSSCGQLRIILNLMDINDHNPIFSKDIYSFNVLENMPAGTLIGQVYAFDADEGINGKIKYSLIGGNGGNGHADSSQSNENNYFSLDSNTGVLTLNSAKLDYETEQHFSLTVEAKDSGVGSLPAYATIDIFVQDKNDNMPEISVSFFNTLKRNGTNIYLKENYEPNKFLALVSLADRDSGENARLDWKVNVNNEEITKSSSNQQLLSLNVLNANSFTINTGTKANVLFDREKNENLNVTIVSWDYGEHTNTAVYNFMIYLLDENDNAPRFEKSEYSLNIYENNEINKIIFRFNATDADLNENAQIVYMLEFLGDHLENEKFVQIDETTGILRATQAFDREFKDTYSFYVIARDSSVDLNKRLWTKVKCTLNILDVNDNRPQLNFNNTAIPYKEYSNKSLLVLRLDENIPLNTSLVDFVCTDFDTNSNGRIKFALNYLKNFQHQPFKLTDDGELLVDKKLDREFIDSYEMQIVCSDQSDNKLKRLNSTLYLNIKINDVNDNCPRSLTNSSALSVSEDYLDNTLSIQARTKFINKNVLLLETTNNKSDLFTVNYTDSDIGKNGELKFQLQTHADLFTIKIDRKSVDYMHTHLLIYTIRIELKEDASNLLKIGKYLLKLKINDNGYPSCIKTETFILYVGTSGEANSQSALIDLLKSIYTANKRTDENALNADFINDQDDQDTSSYDLNDEETDLIQFKSIQQNTHHRPPILNLFKNSQYVIIFILIATLILISLLLSSICLIYCFKKKRSKSIRKAADTLKVKNYRSSSSSNSSSNSDLNHRISNTSTEEENITNSRVHDLLGNDEETKNLLSHQTSILPVCGVNRYSLNTDNNSNSANSVASTYVVTSTHKQRDSACNSSASSKHSNEPYHQNNNIRSHYSNTIYVNSKRNSTFVTQPKPIIYDQNLKNSVSFLSSSSSSSITPPYISYRQMKTDPSTITNNNNNNHHHRFMNDNGTLPNYIRVNRNYQFQQYQRSIMEENNKNKTFMKSFPYNQLNKTIETEKLNKISLNDSTTSSSSSSSNSSHMMVTPSTASDCSEIIIVPTTTISTNSTSLTSSTSPSSVSTTSSITDSEIKYKQYGEFIKNRPINDNETTACLLNNNNNNNNNDTNNRTHFLRSSAV